MTNVKWSGALRVGGLRRFAVSITLFNIVGRLFLGFEQSWAQMFAALLTAYSMELLLEGIHAWSAGRTPLFYGGFRTLVDFLLPVHIAAMAISMLLYANDAVYPFIFATAVAIGSKTIVRIPVGSSSRHFFNPSNLGISVTLLAFPWVGITPPYHFTENLTGIGDWLLPAFIILAGTFLNAKFSKRLPLIAAWLSCFALQAVLRSLFLGTPMLAALHMMTGVAFIVFTFYMITDPSTSPSRPLAQVAFGAATAFTYMLLMLSHIVFGLFFALTIVCGLRGLGIYTLAHAARMAARAKADVSPAAVKQGVEL